MTLNDSLTPTNMLTNPYSLPADIISQSEAKFLILLPLGPQPGWRRAHKAGSGQQQVGRQKHTSLPQGLEPLWDTSRCPVILELSGSQQLHGEVPRYGQASSAGSQPEKGLETSFLLPPIRRSQ